MADCLLILLFHWCLHPWLAILQEERTGERERILEQVKDMIIEVDMPKQALEKFLSENLEDTNSSMFVRSVVNMTEADEIQGSGL